jgi:hypothetical protein
MNAMRYSVMYIHCELHIPGDGHMPDTCHGLFNVMVFNVRLTYDY